MVNGTTSRTAQGRNHLPPSRCLLGQICLQLLELLLGNLAAGVAASSDLKRARSIGC